MPIQVIARGGTHPIQNIHNLDANQATEILKRVKARVNLPNKSSGVFVLVNRGRNGAEMELKRKSGFQLFGRGMGNTRLNQTRIFWDVVLRQAGRGDAANRLTEHLSNKPGRHANRVDVAFIQNLLREDNVKAPVSDPDSAVAIDDPKPRSESSGSFEIQEDGIAQSDQAGQDARAVQAQLQPQASLEHQPQVQAQPLSDAQPQPGAQQASVSVPVSGPPPELAAAHGPSQGVDQVPQQARVPVGARRPLAQGASLAIVRKRAGFQIGRKLGEGAFGTVNLLTLGQDQTPRVLKTFRGGKTPNLYASRNSRVNEATASYLVSRKEGGYAQNAGVAETQYFTVHAGGKFQMVDSLGLRELLKRSPEGSVMLHEIVMEKVDGQEALEHVVGGRLTPGQRKELTRQMLTSLKELNRRGFAVRDHKWENVMYDPGTGKAKLIDTGMFHKVSKKRPETRFIHGSIGGTLRYMHMRAISGAHHGSETDVYAQAMMTLMLEHPKAMVLMRENMLDGIATRTLVAARKKGTKVDDGIDSKIFRLYVEDLRRQAPRHPELEALYRAIQDPDSLCGLAMKCLDESSKPASEWATRSTAQSIFADLLAHPAVN